MIDVGGHIPKIRETAASIALLCSIQQFVICSLSGHPIKPSCRFAMRQPTFQRIPCPCQEMLERNLQSSTKAVVLLVLSRDKLRLSGVQSILWVCNDYTICIVAILDLTATGSLYSNCKRHAFGVLR